ncbi:MAG: PilZ domain-containing protein [Cellvibrionaceae bacterium]
MNHAVTASDRRRFFRINDNVGVNYRQLKESELNQHIDALANPADSLSIIADCNKQIETLLSQLAIKEPLIADLVGAMNKKVNCVIQQLELETQLTQSLAHKIQEVNISACGMALTTEELLESGTVLDLELMLLPGRYLLHCHGIVVDATAANEGEGFHTRVDFSGMCSEDQELLIQHIVKRQGALLKALRDDEALKLPETKS